MATEARYTYSVTIPRKSLARPVKLRTEWGVTRADEHVTRLFNTLAEAREFARVTYTRHTYPMPEPAKTQKPVSRHGRMHR